MTSTRIARKILLLAALIQAVLAKLHVSQDREVRADDGDDAILRCYFTCQHNVTLGSFKWYKDRVGGREVSEKSFHNRLDRTGTQTFLNKKDASITIRRVSFQDAGVYFCEVDLAGVGKANGSGTELKINKGSEQLQVHQNPEVTFNLGQNAHLPCRFNARNVVQIGSYKWYKDHVGGTEVSNGTHGKAILKTNIETFIKDKNASITILQPSHNDSGYYYCEVDLLGIGRANGSGTLLRVNEGTSNGQSNADSFTFDINILATILAGSSAVILIVIISSICYCKKKQRRDLSGPRSSSSR
ncbi:uncharacterized protein LOC114664833 [Erpetoichthys calabaricus]|uniref:uncharacterized protein LOC114664833 n=1 Tax=Erpetoichthys calabaricus TaxID=27687 RepID=UPI00223488FD|nr:uncharacterized protein LOC114664833 [Erpetoichthys calabaricus]